jgi:hypothetical protein
LMDEDTPKPAEKKKNGQRGPDKVKRKQKGSTSHATGPPVFGLIHPDAFQSFFAPKTMGGVGGGGGGGGGTTGGGNRGACKASEGSESDPGKRKRQMDKDEEVLTDEEDSLVEDVKKAKLASLQDTASQQDTAGSSSKG